MVQGQVFLKGGWEGWHFSYLNFLRFIIFIFNHSTLCKTIFFATIIFGGHSKFSKNEPENIPLIKITYSQRDLKY